MSRLMVWMVLGSILTPTMVWAHNLLPPPWHGQEGTTYQEWRFDNDNDTLVVPEEMNNPYGNATAQITVGEFGSGWMAGGPPGWEQEGFWDIGRDGSIVLDIDNSLEPLLYKEIWVQVTYLQGPSEQPGLTVIGADFISQQTILVAPDPPSSWYLHQSRWRIEPNPDHEQIVLIGNPLWGSVIDQIVVHTICIPEPASIMLLLLGVGAILRRRR